MLCFWALGEKEILMIHTLSPAEEEDLQTAPLTPPMGWSRFVQVYTVQIGNYWPPTKAQNI